MKKIKTIAYSKTSAQNRRIVIRPYKLSDFKACHSSHTNRLEIQNEYDRPIKIAQLESYSEFKIVVERSRRRAKEREQFTYGVFDKKTGAFIGQIALMEISNHLRWYNLGYHIQNQFYSKGYATEACKLLLKIGFKQLGIHRIEASMLFKNKASRKVAEKIGMIYEGKRINPLPNIPNFDSYVFGANVRDFK